MRPGWMPGTAFSVPESNASRLAAGYARNSRKQLVLVTQLLPSGTFDFRNQLKAIVYPAIVD
jgi:hypothetical protein